MIIKRRRIRKLKRLKRTLRRGEPIPAHLRGLSRQRRWQLRKLAEGLCETCGARPLRTKHQCEVCSPTPKLVKRRLQEAADAAKKAAEAAKK